VSSRPAPVRPTCGAYRGEAERGKEVRFRCKLLAGHRGLHAWIVDTDNGGSGAYDAARGDWPESIPKPREDT
jgi:hypothetical protein